MWALGLKLAVMLVAFWIDPEERARRRKKQAEDVFNRTMKRSTKAVGEMNPDDLFEDLQDL